MMKSLRYLKITSYAGALLCLLLLGANLLLNLPLHDSIARPELADVLLLACLLCAAWCYGLLMHDSQRIANSDNTEYTAMWDHVNRLLYPHQADRTARHEPQPPSFDVIASIEHIGDEQLWTEIMDAYLEEAESAISGMREALGNGDADELVDCAHSLRGGSAEVKADVVCDLAADAELRARRLDLAEYHKLIDNIEREYRVIERELLLHRLAKPELPA